MIPASHPHRIRLALTAGVIAAFFSLLLQAIEEFLHHPMEDQLKELVVIAITSIGMLLAIEPVLERIVPRREHHGFAHEDDILIRAGAFLTIVATSLLHGLLHAHITQRITLDGMIILEQLSTALVAPTLITLCWLYGTRREPARARWYGLIGGLLTGVVMVILAILQLYFLRPGSGLGEASASNAATALLVVATIFLWFIIPTCAINGYLGGLALDRRWGRRAWSGIAVALLIAIAVEAGSFYLATSVQAPAIKSAALAPQRLFGSLFADAVIANIGWTIGIWVRSDADESFRAGPQPQLERRVWREVSIAITSAVALLVMALSLSFGTIALGNRLTTRLVARTQDQTTAVSP